MSTPKRKRCRWCGRLLALSRFHRKATSTSARTARPRPSDGTTRPTGTDSSRGGANWHANPGWPGRPTTTAGTASRSAAQAGYRAPAPIGSRSGPAPRLLRRAPRLIEYQPYPPPRGRPSPRGTPRSGSGRRGRRLQRGPRRPAGRLRGLRRDGPARAPPPGLQEPAARPLALRPVPQAGGSATDRTAPVIRVPPGTPSPTGPGHPVGGDPDSPCRRAAEIRNPKHETRNRRPAAGRN
jgi:hypothetical protein